MIGMQGELPCSTISLYELTYQVMESTLYLLPFNVEYAKIELIITFYLKGMRYSIVSTALSTTFILVTQVNILYGLTQMCEKYVHSYKPQFLGWGGGLSLCPNLENGKNSFFQLIRNPASIGEREEGGVVGF
jgi:hypothetical protein